MLTQDQLRASDALKDLTDDQLKVIEALSKRDEEDTIAKKVGEMHSRYDVDIQEATGLQKQAGEKTYHFLKRAMKEVIQANDPKQYQDQIKKLEEEKAELIKNGDSAKIKELQKQIDDRNQKIELLKDQHKAKIEEMNGEIQSFASKMQDQKLQSMFDQAIVGLQFDEAIPEVARKAVISQVRNQIFETKKEWETIDGKEIPIFYTPEGEKLRAKDTLEPLTVADLVAQRTQSVVKQPGGGAGGAGGGKPGGKPGTGVDLSKVTDTVSLTAAIQTHLKELGVPRGSKEWSEKQTELYKELRPTLS